MDMGRNTQRIAHHPFQGRVWRDLAQFAGEALAVGLLVSLVLALAIFIATTQVQAAEPARYPGASTPAQGAAVLHADTGEENTVSVKREVQ
jgi:hypothetical protein